MRFQLLRPENIVTLQLALHAGVECFFEFDVDTTAEATNDPYLPDVTSDTQYRAFLTKDGAPAFNDNRGNGFVVGASNDDSQGTTVFVDDYSAIEPYIQQWEWSVDEQLAIEIEGHLRKAYELCAANNLPMFVRVLHGGTASKMRMSKFGHMAGSRCMPVMTGLENYWSHMEKGRTQND